MVWNTDTADKRFSEMIRERDKKCVCCRTRQAVQCSHFWERHHSATRYDPRNGDGICGLCHPLWEGRKNGYKEYKVKQLGLTEYREMEWLHNTVMKRDVAIMRFIKVYHEYTDKR